MRSRKVPQGSASDHRGVAASENADYARGNLHAQAFHPAGGYQTIRQGARLPVQVTASTQTTDSVPYAFTYTYNLRGHRKDVGYPSGRSVSYSLSGRGLPVSAGSYAVSGTYAPHGGILGQTLGNGVAETTVWDAKLQWKSVHAVKGPLDETITNTYAANGNVKTQNVVFGGANFTQTFGYDGVNRLTTVSEANGSTSTWSQTNAYDRWGNRAMTASIPLNLATATSVNQYNPVTNRLGLLSDNTSLPVNAYDAAGNIRNHPRMGVGR